MVISSLALAKERLGKWSLNGVKIPEP